MDDAKFNKYIDMGIFALALGGIVNVLNNNYTDLKTTCVLLLVYVLLDKFKDIREGRSK